MPPQCEASKLRLILIPTCSVGSQSVPEKTLRERQKLAGPQISQPVSPSVFRRFALPHPSCPQQVVDFFVSGRGTCDKSNIFELHRATRECGRTSAFLLQPELVLQDGSLLLAVPVDPLLLLLPLIRQHQHENVNGGRFVCSGADKKQPEDTLSAGHGYFWSILDVGSGGCNYEDSVRRNIKALALHPAVLCRLHFICEVRPLGNTKEHVDSPDAASRVSSEIAVTGLFRMATEGKLYVRYDETRSMEFIKRRFLKLGNTLQRHGNAFGRKLVDSSYQSEVSLQQCGKSENTDKGGVDIAAESKIHFDSSVARVAFELLRCYLPRPVADKIGAQLEKEYSLQVLPKTVSTCVINDKQEKVAKAPAHPPVQGFETESKEETTKAVCRKRRRNPPTSSGKTRKVL